MTAGASRLRFLAPPGMTTGFALLLIAVACKPKPDAPRIARIFQARPQKPDELPRVINADLPFRYPPALYARKTQGNVTLKLFIDRNGRPVADSTRVQEKSAFPALDSAALKGAAELRFIPAKLDGEPMSITVLFPVYFRHPEARALPGDTILTRRGSTP